jgi:hypothetical protein
MDDYNDGSWWGWDGGECPVHPHSEVEAAFVSATKKGLIHENRRAGLFVWDAPVTRVVAFRVTKPYREPREIWVNEYTDIVGAAYLTEKQARDAALRHAIRTAVRYVEAPE